MEARESALRCVHKINFEDAYTNNVLQEALKSVNQKDKSFLTNIVYGTIKNQIYIDWIISKSSAADFDKTEPWILDILRISVYQILFMDRVPYSAACDEGVKLAKLYSRGKAYSFVNAVLRGIVRDKEKLCSIDIKNKIKYLSVKYSFPKWIIKLWTEQMTLGEVEDLCNASNMPAPLTIRTNTLKISPDVLKKLFREKGLLIEDGIYNDEAVIINDTIDITTLAEYERGYFVLQDESSMMVAKALCPSRGEFIIDICAAPGGKTTHAAAIMGDSGKILARDIYEHKIEKMSQNIERLGITSIATEVYDAQHLDKDLVEKADKVIADIPCSGLGVIRRKPDIKLLKNDIHIQDIISLQRQILQNAVCYLKNNGVLIFSTCTLNVYENEANVKYLIDECNMELEDVTAYLPEGVKGMVKGGVLKLLPNTSGTDGFFIARLRKK